MDLPLFRKAAAYCAYQERTQDEVRTRLKKWKVYGEEAEEIIAALIEQNFLSEERFAKAYSGGKFRIKSWGRLKIKQELERKGLSGYNVRAAMEEISQEQYRERLTRLVEKKKESLERTESDPRKITQKLMRFALMKGYEADLVNAVLKDIAERDKNGGSPGNSF